MKVSIINLGSQYTHVIWRTCRELGVEGVIQQPTVPAADADFFDAFILSGGPASAPEMPITQPHRLIAETASGKSEKPVFGICLGHQLITHVLGGKVEKGPSAEYGVSEIEVDKPGTLLAGVPPKFRAWVSHFDEVTRAPDGFEILAHSATCKIEAMEHVSRPLYGVQFHPEVWHTQHGEKILENFLKTVKA
ncbi:MAG: GMP synthase subunit A [Candidatus Micrarchaeota archaeon]|nr:GMP synthase subunit A [Candidatus Micrarchaeota archaeon]